MLGREQSGSTEINAYDPSGVMRQALDAWSLSAEEQADLNVSTPPREHVYLWIMRLPPSVNPREAAQALLDVTQPPPSTQNTNIAAFSLELRGLLKDLCKASDMPKGRRGGRNARLAQAETDSH